MGEDAIYERARAAAYEAMARRRKKRRQVSEGNANSTHDGPAASGLEQRSSDEAQGPPEASGIVSGAERADEGSSSHGPNLPDKSRHTMSKGNLEPAGPSFNSTGFVPPTRGQLRASFLSLALQASAVLDTVELVRREPFHGVKLEYVNGAHHSARNLVAFLCAIARGLTDEDHE